MAAVSGMRYTYSDTVGVKLNIEDEIVNIDPKDRPLITLLGLNSTSNPVTELKYEWIQDALQPYTDALGADMASGAVTANVVSGAKFRDNDIIMVGSQLLRVSASPSAAGTCVLLVNPGFGSSDMASGASGATVTIIGSAAEQGADAGEALSQVRTTDYNYTQIFEADVKESGTDNAIAKYGVTNEYDYQVSKKMIEVAQQLERTAIFGYRGAASSGIPGAMGGLVQFLDSTDSNVTSKSTEAFTEAFLNDLIQNCWNDGGNPDTLMVNFFQARKMASWQSSRITIDRSEQTAGNVVTRYQALDGIFLNVVLNRFMPTDSAYVLEKKYLGIGPLSGRGFFTQLLSISGDSKKGQVLGEYTMEVRAPGAHGRLTGLTTS
jgi:hypothetical protein